MTTTTVLNAVTLAAAGAENTNISKVTLQAGTNKVSLEVLLVSSVAENTTPKCVDVRYVFSCRDITANAAAVTALVKASRALQVKVPTEPSSVTAQSMVIPPAGGFLYLWVDHATKAGTSTLSVFLNELL